MKKTAFPFPSSGRRCVFGVAEMGNAPDSLIAWSLLTVGYNSAVCLNLLGWYFVSLWRNYSKKRDAGCCG